jgi:hypothetical protein
MRRDRRRGNEDQPDLGIATSKRNSKAGMAAMVDLFSL